MDQNNPNLLERESRIQADEETLQALHQNGADFEKGHAIDFLFVGDKDRLAKIEPILIQQGFSKHPDQSKENSLLVIKNIKLREMKSHLITENLESLANDYGVAFDGWGTVT